MRKSLLVDPESSAPDDITGLLISSFIRDEVKGNWQDMTVTFMFSNASLEDARATEDGFFEIDGISKGPDEGVDWDAIRAPKKGDMEILQRSIFMFIKNLKGIDREVLRTPIGTDLYQYLSVPTRLWTMEFLAEDYLCYQDHSKLWQRDFETYIEWQKLAARHEELLYTPDEYFRTEEEEDDTPIRNVIEIGGNEEYDSILRKKAQDIKAILGGVVDE